MFFDLRSNERYEFPYYKVEYTLGHFSDNDIFEADLINANEVGLCMLLSQRLTVGQEITLKNLMRRIFQINLIEFYLRLDCSSQSKNWRP
jgi:hypothetical protein